MILREMENAYIWLGCGLRYPIQMPNSASNLRVNKILTNKMLLGVIRRK